MMMLMISRVLLVITTRHSSGLDHLVASQVMRDLARRRIPYRVECIPN